MQASAKSRPYDSPLRRKQAAATRRQILAAARRLFERQGYAATSVAAIAEETGVAQKTVYLAFETKGGLLRALWHLLLRGDEKAVPVGEREWFLEVLGEPDPGRQLELNAHYSRIVKSRVAGVFEVIRSAASADPEVGALWQRIQSEFHATQRRILESIAEKGALAEGLDVTGATDIVWTLNHPDVYRLLVIGRGWTPDEYERWLAGAFREQVLPPACGP